uniref:Secreted protein n=1 Tax=Rhabditophanes sp. KR3021 TaxID=114890 RepID=A0AC35TNY2_9BILA
MTSVHFIIVGLYLAVSTTYSFPFALTPAISDDVLDAILSYFPKDVGVFLATLTPQEMAIVSQIAGEKPLSSTDDDWSEFMLIVRDQSESLYSKIIREKRKQNEKRMKLSFKGRDFIKLFEAKQNSAFLPHAIELKPLTARMAALDLYLKYIALSELDKQDYSTPRERNQKLSLSSQEPGTPLTDARSPDLNNLDVYKAQLIIVSALQGIEYNDETSHEFSTALSKAEMSVKKMMYKFFTAKNGACASTMENNACKAFHCNPADLSSVELNKENIRNLKRLWMFLKDEILPNIVLLLYPLGYTFGDFNEREVLFTFFRDKVCLRIFKNNKRKISSLHTIMHTLLCEAEDYSESAKEFRRLASIVLDGGEDYTLSSCSTNTLPSTSSGLYDFDMEDTAYRRISCSSVLTSEFDENDDVFVDEQYFHLENIEFEAISGEVNV